MAKILLVDGDAESRQMLRVRLEREGYETYQANDGSQALDLVRAHEPDLIILEADLPHLDGFAVCRILRFERDTPMLMLSARQDEADRVRGLDMGADDYVIKPYLPNELLARVRALLRRSAHSLLPSSRQVLSIGNIMLDMTHHRVFRGDDEVYLSHKEFDLLACLMHNPGAILSREMLLEHVWGQDFKNDTRTVDVHIRWLREKIEPNPASPRYIFTVRGLGYRFAEERVRN